MKAEDTLHKTWEYKGIEIKPLTRARKFHLSKMVDFSNISPWDIALLLFALTCKEKTLIKGLRNQEYFDEEVSKWIDKEELEMAELDESVMELIKEIMEHSDMNKAVPVKDENMMEDPTGNV